MTTIVKIKRMVRKIDPDRELFSVNLLTPTGRAGDARMKAVVVRELLALTLAGNRDLAKILQAYRKKLGFDKLLPKDLYDQWISRRVHDKGVPEEISDQKKRCERRDQIVDLTRQEYSRVREQLPQGEDAVEHIALRVYAAEILKPQSKGKPRHQLLAIAYHLKQQWVHVETRDISQNFLAWDKEKKRADHSRMLTQSQWKSLAQALRNRAEAEGTSQNTAIVIHAPQGCRLSDLMKIPGVCTVDDMPSIPAESVEITYRVKGSKQLRLMQESFASILRKPTKDDLLSDVEMSDLPELTGLTHQEKDKLIQTLWKKISILSQNAAMAKPGAPPT